MKEIRKCKQEIATIVTMTVESAILLEVMDNRYLQIDGRVCWYVGAYEPKDDGNIIAAFRIISEEEEKEKYSFKAGDLYKKVGCVTLPSQMFINITGGDGSKEKPLIIA